jgi:hypothetical protein
VRLAEQDLVAACDDDRAAEAPGDGLSQPCPQPFRYAGGDRRGGWLRWGVHPPRPLDHVADGVDDGRGLLLGDVVPTPLGDPLDRLG